MKFKSLISVAAAFLITSAYAAGAASEDMTNPADDISGNAMTQGPLADNSGTNGNIGAMNMNGDQLAQGDSSSSNSGSDADTSNSNDDSSADTATGDDDY